MSELPEGIEDFLADTPWQASRIVALPGDASFRRYFRLHGNGSSAMLMHAPPPHEDPQPFLDVAGWLTENGQRAPVIHAVDAQAGWVLTEDFGDERVREWVDRNPADERAIYTRAVDTLIDLHARPPGPFAPYDMATYQREAGLFPEWFCEAANVQLDRAAWDQAWDEVLASLLTRQQPGVTVLRDYHAENIMLPTDGGQGLIDFQDALVGHRAYDLVSLLQDARRDVSPQLEQDMIAHYVAGACPGEDFAADYARLGAQRNAKIVGIFTRLAKRDGKPKYLDLIPRVWRLLERDLVHPALEPVARWFDDNIPAQLREAEGRVSA